MFNECALSRKRRKTGKNFKPIQRRVESLTKTGIKIGELQWNITFYAFE